MMSPETPPPSSEGDSIDLTTADERGDLNVAPCQLNITVKKRKNRSSYDSGVNVEHGAVNHFEPDTSFDLTISDDEKNDDTDIALLLRDARKRKIFSDAVNENSAAEQENDLNGLAAPVDLTCDDHADTSADNFSNEISWAKRTLNHQPDAPVDLTSDDDTYDTLYAILPDTPQCQLDERENILGNEIKMVFKFKDNSTQNEPVVPVDLTLDDDCDANATPSLDEKRKESCNDGADVANDERNSVHNYLEDEGKTDHKKLGESLDLKISDDENLNVPPALKPAVKGKKKGRKRKTFVVKSEPQVKFDLDEPDAPKRKLRTRIPIDKKPETGGQDVNFFALRESIKQLSTKLRRSTGQALRFDRTEGLSRCRICRQPLSSAIAYSGPPNDAIDEKTALQDATLQLSYETGELPQNKLTLFSVYDEEGHLCPLDGGCIERNETLRVSGYMKPIYDEDPSASGGIPVNDLGPVTQWWIYGYDGGPEGVIGITTADGEYHLMNPSPSYSPLMEELLEKIYLGKIVIEYLIKEEHASYEELLNHIQTIVPPSGVRFTEDTLLRHAQFVCDQVVSYDEAGYSDDESETEDDWRKLVTAPCMRSLISLAGGRVQGSSRRPQADPWRRDSDEEESDSDDDEDDDYKEEEYRPKRVINRNTGESKPSRIPRTKATTTPLVNSIFDSLFTDELDTTNRISIPLKNMTNDRCGRCEPCKLRDCGSCVFCAMRVEFGELDNDKMVCIKRRCVNLGGGQNPLPRNPPPADDESIHELSDSDEESQEEDESVSDGSRPVEWIGEALYSNGGVTYYRSAKVGNSEVEVGDFVQCEPHPSTNPAVIGRVAYLFEDEYTQKFMHLQNFIHGSETILGESADPHELFAGDHCEDTLLKGVTSVISVYKTDINFSEWQNEGGLPLETQHYDKTQFFFSKRYNVFHARFEDMPSEPPCPEGVSKFEFCACCYSAMEKIAFAQPRTCDPVREEDKVQTEPRDKPIEFSYVSWRGEKYSRGTCVYLSPDAFEFEKKGSEMLIRPDEEFPAEYDEDLFPERYRTKFDARKAMNETTPDPFCIGLISKIVSKNCGLNRPDDITLHVFKFYRPENTTDIVSDLYQVDLTMLFASDEDDSVSFSQVHGKCHVAYSENLRDVEDMAKWSFDGPDRFYFTHAYDDTHLTITEPNELFKMLGLSKKGSEENGSEIPSWPKISRPLRCLDVFAGCGGLSDGLHKSGVAESKWAVDVVDTAAGAFKLNNPDSTVFTMDCNHFLKNVIAGDTADSRGQLYPQKGDVEILVGGPPCQGFSGLNRFNSGVYSSFKNSLVVSYLSFCDYYRPRYFILENVRNFVSFNKNMVLKLTLRCLLQMGYQVAVGILQAGHYGVPQTRRRAIIMAAAPGEILPLYPEPRHVFHPRAGSLAIVLDGIKIDAGHQFKDSAPLRTITVYDAMSDLPEIENGDKEEEKEYKREPLTHFQRLVRPVEEVRLVVRPVEEVGEGEDKNKKFRLRDHICKNMCEMVATRIEHIPLTRNADWRDLPNIEVELKSGAKCNKLMYEYEHEFYKRSGTGALRGVCSCNSKGGRCDPMDRQSNTLIPWCMPHTGHRNNNWSGLYGRLQWGDFFGTTVTNPEPMGKQGRVLHPNQNRVVSVRECARSQGFDDTYRFNGPILEKHRQVGNAVPPPMGKAIGLEIRKCLSKIEKRFPRGD